MSLAPAGPAQHEAVAGLVGRAFAADPFWRWLTRGRPARRAHFARLAVGVAAAHGEVLAAPVHAALVVEPGALPHAPHRSAPQVVGVARSCGARRLPLVLAELLRIEALHPREPHLTLLVLAVEPAHQGAGHGGAALDLVAERADRRGLPLYLETSTERARALYARHGFVDRERTRIAHRGPPVWTMLRPVGA